MKKIITIATCILACLSISANPDSAPKRTVTLPSAINSPSKSTTKKSTPTTQKSPAAPTAPKSSKNGIETTGKGKTQGPRGDSSSGASQSGSTSQSAPQSSGVATCYFAIDADYCIDNNANLIGARDWTVKFTNDNGMVRVFQNPEVHYTAYTGGQAPDSHLHRDLLDKYYVKIEVPEAMLGKNKVNISNSITSWNTDLDIKRGGITLTAHTPGQKMRLFIAIPKGEKLKNSTANLAPNHMDITIKNENGRTKTFKNVVVVPIDGFKRRDLSDKQRQDLANYMYAYVVLPYSFEGKNDVTVSIPQGKWTFDTELETNSTVTRFLYADNLK